MKTRKMLQLHLRGLKDLNGKCPQLIPSIFANAIITALSPYVTVWFSARLLGELSASRRPEVLGRWAVLTVVSLGLMALLTALADRWWECVKENTWYRKQQIFIEKQFSMDYAALEDQKNRDLREKIREVENWSDWGYMRIPLFLREILKSVLGILGGIALTVSLFTAKLPGALPSANACLAFSVLLGKSGAGTRTFGCTISRIWSGNIGHKILPFPRTAPWAGWPEESWDFWREREPHFPRCLRESFTCLPA